MRKEYDLRSLKVKRRGPLQAVASKRARTVAEKSAKGATGRAKRHR